MRLTQKLVKLAVFVQALVKRYKEIKTSNHKPDNLSSCDMLNTYDIDKLVRSWYVLHTKSRFENVVTEGLTKKSIEVFLPKIKVRSKRIDRKTMIYMPLFPGYVFVKTDLNPYEHIEIVKTIGAVRIIGNKDSPLSVPQKSIDSLKIIVAGNNSVTTGTRFKKGDIVTVIDGPLAGIMGTFIRYKGKERVAVYIEGLGQFASVEVSKDDVEIISKIL